MSDGIPKKPTDVPAGLREAAQRGTLIPFVGAGASILAGCPGWAEFADGALSHFVAHGMFTYSQLDQIKHLNPRVKLSLAMALQKEHKLPIDFRKLLHPKGRVSDDGEKLYGSLSRLGKIFVTTNYDEWLDEEIAGPGLTLGAVPNPAAPLVNRERKVIHNVNDLIPARLNQPGTVIHLHGSLLAPDDMVMTTQDYVRHYANDRLSGDTGTENRVLTFLEYLFEKKTVLFVGYGLEELEILEYVILKARRLSGTGPPEAKHFMLQGFFSHEQELMRSLKRYYLEACGIELLPYLRDHRDWRQLLEVLEAFARLVPASDPMVLQDFKEMENLLDG
ncbi:MAG TPA: SIR2 family protein [Candidatus Deferrimicrobiaceae bacterium]